MPLHGEYAGTIVATGFSGLLASVEKTEVDTIPAPVRVGMTGTRIIRKRESRFQRLRHSGQ